MEIKEYKELFESIKKEVKDKDVALEIMKEILNDRRANEIAKERSVRHEAQSSSPSGSGQSSEKATDKQIAYLVQLGYTGTTNLSKLEATACIKAKKAEREQAEYAGY